MATAGQRVLPDNMNVMTRKTKEVEEAEKMEAKAMIMKVVETESAAAEAAKTKVTKAGEILMETKREEAVPAVGAAAAAVGGRRTNSVEAETGYGFGAPYFRGRQSDRADLKVLACAEVACEAVTFVQTHLLWVSSTGF
jgi:hypothetical protein